MAMKLLTTLTALMLVIGIFPQINGEEMEDHIDALLERRIGIGLSHDHPHETPSPLLAVSHTQLCRYAVTEVNKSIQNSKRDIPFVNLVVNVCLPGSNAESLMELLMLFSAIQNGIAEGAVATTISPTESSENNQWGPIDDWLNGGRKPDSEGNAITTTMNPTESSENNQWGPIYDWLNGGTEPDSDEGNAITTTMSPTESSENDQWGLIYDWLNGGTEPEGDEETPISTTLATTSVPVPVTTKNEENEIATSPALTKKIDTEAPAEANEIPDVNNEGDVAKKHGGETNEKALMLLIKKLLDEDEVATRRATEVMDKDVAIASTRATKVIDEITTALPVPLTTEMDLYDFFNNFLFVETDDAVAPEEVNENDAVVAKNKITTSPATTTTKIDAEATANETDGDEANNDGELDEKALMMLIKKLLTNQR